VSGLTTALITVLIGVLTLTVGQVLIRGLLEPGLELKRLIGRVAHDLDFYANKMFDDPEAQAARDAFRKDACELRERLYLVVWYWLFFVTWQLPRRKNVARAAQLLIGQSNFPAKIQPPLWWHDQSGEIKKLLRITT